MTDSGSHSPEEGVPQLWMSWVPDEVWTRATDASVPPGVIVLIDSDGTRHPMPLIEFGDLT